MSRRIIVALAMLLAGCSHIANTPQTPPEMLRAHALVERTSAAGQPGTVVCRLMVVGIGVQDWLRARVTGIESGRLVMRIVDAGRFQHVIGSVTVAQDVTLRDDIMAWTPCG